MGYTFKGENGIPRRHYFLKGEPCTHHIHLLEKTSEEWERLILFRDYLRSNQNTAEEYKKLKRDLSPETSRRPKSLSGRKDRFRCGNHTKKPSNHPPLKVAHTTLQNDPSPPTPTTASPYRADTYRAAAARK